MPLMEITLMDQKKEFILLWKTEQYSLSYLCRDFNISRPTGYRYIEKIQKVRNGRSGKPADNCKNNS